MRAIDRSVRGAAPTSTCRAGCGAATPSPLMVRMRS